MLTFAKPLAQLAQREWQVGEHLLVNWTRDAFWYPATVVKKEGKRYSVRFDDGDEEWTASSRMTQEDIEVGDKVFANFKNLGRYYPGTVAKRQGRKVHIRYDDGDAEVTTIASVRVLRPKAQHVPAAR